LTTVGLVPRAMALPHSLCNCACMHAAWGLTALFSCPRLLSQPRAPRACGRRPHIKRERMALLTGCLQPPGFMVSEHIHNPMFCHSNHITNTCTTTSMLATGTAVVVRLQWRSRLRNVPHSKKHGADHTTHAHAVVCVGPAARADNPTFSCMSLHCNHCCTELLRLSSP
jgi:hypothetical protein